MTFLARSAATLAVTSLLLTAAACLKSRELPVLERRGAASRDDIPVGSSSIGFAGRSADLGARAGAEAPQPQPIVCVRGGDCQTLSVETARALDILFVIDNTASMAGPQAAVRAQLPNLLASLAYGKTDSGVSFPPVRDIHLGVVSTDMGVPGTAPSFPGCDDDRHFNGGDDGILRQSGGARDASCQKTFPKFLEWKAGDDVGRIAEDLGCITTLGTGGCGFEQPLEAALKALWPRTYLDASGAHSAADNPVQFLNPMSADGHGDAPGDTGNAGFARNDPATLLSTLLIVVVTDSDDCSSSRTDHFAIPSSPDDPLHQQSQTVRCALNRGNMFDVKRYVLGFPALRAGHEDSVLFAAIAGVPRDLIDASAQAQLVDGARREVYYSRILNDPRMEERTQDADDPKRGSLMPSCGHSSGGGPALPAFPPRRIVEVARGLGPNALVQSICDDDLGGAMNAIADFVGGRQFGRCLPVALPVSSDGKVRCDVIAELPAAVLDNAASPTDCDAPGYANVQPPRDARNAAGGRNCVVTQLARTAPGMAPTGDGFYYDDFSPDSQHMCAGRPLISLSGTQRAHPPLRLHLDCAGSAPVIR